MQKYLIAAFVSFFIFFSTAPLAEATERVIDIHGIPTGYTDRGPDNDSEPIIFIHALGLDHHMWDDTLAAMPSGHRLIAYDIRGHGLARGFSASANMNTLAEDLEQLLNHLQARRGHIVGLSMGGVIAQTFATKFPERVASLTLVATTPLPQAAFELRGESGRRDGIAAQLAPTLPRWFTSEQLAENGAAVVYARQMLLNNKPSDWQSSWHAMATMNVHRYLPDFRTPTLVIAGEKDVSCPPALMRDEIALRIPGAKFVVVPGAPHMVSLTSSFTLAKLIEGFISEVTKK